MLPLEHSAILLTFWYWKQKFCVLYELPLKTGFTLQGNYKKKQFSHPAISLSRLVAMCTAIAYGVPYSMEYHTPCQWNLATDQVKPSALAAQWQGHDISSQRMCHCGHSTVKPALSGHSKRRPKIVFQDRLSLNEGQKYCRMLQENVKSIAECSKRMSKVLQNAPREHSAILLTFI